MSHCGRPGTEATAFRAAGVQMPGLAQRPQFSKTDVCGGVAWETPGLQPTQRVWWPPLFWAFLSRAGQRPYQTQQGPHSLFCQVRNQFAVKKLTFCVSVGCFVLTQWLGGSIDLGHSERPGEEAARVSYGEEETVLLWGGLHFCLSLNKQAVFKLKVSFSPQNVSLRQCTGEVRQDTGLGKDLFDMTLNHRQRNEIASDDKASAQPQK